MHDCLRPVAFGLVILCGLACDAVETEPPRPAHDHAPHASSASQLPPATLDSLMARNLAAGVSLPVEVLEAHMRDWQDRPVGERIALWAELFRERGDATYRFGLLEGGYVAEGLLVQDFKPDCVLFFYRCTDLARSSTAQEAVLQALDTRFANAVSPPVDEHGRVDYKNAAHIDYSLDIVRSGIWGRDVTSAVGVAIPDSVGTSRYPAGSFNYIPTAQLRTQNLRDGDHLFFVLDESSARGRKLREEYGLVVGHQGIARIVGDEVYLIHAASKDLPGEYSGNRVVRVLLRTYLERVDSHKGVLVARVEGDPTIK